MSCATPALCPVYAITAAGAGITGAADQFTFVYQRLTGDGTITMRVASLSTAAGEAGVMMRESLAANAREVAMTAGSTLAFKRRTATGGTTASTTRSRPAGAVWLRLQRAAGVVISSISVDGTQWTLVGSATIALPSTVYVGIAVTGNAATSPVKATVSNFAIASTATLPQGWAATDIGQAPSLGSASYASGSYTLSSTGAGLAGTADALRLVYVRVTGDATVIARLPATQGAAGHYAGITLRETLDAGARHATFSARDGALVWTQRLSPQASSSSANVVTRLPPVWLKLERRGTTLIASYSADGATWTARPPASLALGSDLYAGVFVAGGTSLTRAAAAFDNVKVVAAAANVPPSVSITSPAPGKTFTQGSPVTITASASDPDDIVASVEFMINGTKIANDTAAPFSATWIAGAPGGYTLTARALDPDGAVTTSSPVSIGSLASGTSAPPSASTPSTWWLAFDAPSDHATITSYAMDVFVKSTGVRLTSKNLGKPPLSAAGTCEVDVTTVLAALPAGLYDIVVKSVTSAGTSSSTPALLAK